MQSENRMFDDLVKVLNGAAGTFAGMTREAEAPSASAMREWVGGLDMVSREEFEAVKAIAVAAREESAGAEGRLDALEAATAAKPKQAGAPRPVRGLPANNPQHIVGRLICVFAPRARARADFVPN